MELSWTEVRLITMVVFAGVGCWTDLLHHRIPNKLTLSVLCAGLALAFFHHDFFGLFNALLGVVCAGGVFLFFYAMGGFGAGDVKMIGALGSLTGFPLCLALIAYVAVAGGVIAIVTLARQGMLWTGLKQSIGVLFGRTTNRLEVLDADEDVAGESCEKQQKPAAEGASRRQPHNVIPYGLATLAGACCVYLFEGRM